MSKSENFIPYFLSHRNVTIALAEKVEKANYDFKPTETSMSAEKLVLHMVTSFYQFTAAATKQQPKQLHEEGSPFELGEVTKLYTDETLVLLKNMVDEDFKEIIDLTAFLGTKLPAEQVLRIALDHEINHKGNLFVYVRMMGHTDLPMFVQK
ncbi:DinB family protein [Evansella sp. AB-rgal1]|uniref:DinB family protein n=1 Tax=Evansella sp. AB-rgal1 TaxID=3242696 RepID=UPI00359E2697